MAPQITPWKRCTRCGEVKDRQRDFYPVRRNDPRPYVMPTCKACAMLAQDEYRAANVEMLRDKRKAKRAADPEKYRKLEAIRYESSPGVQLTRAARDTPCVDCGVRLPPQVMELDHVRGTKAFNLGGPRLSRRSADEVRAEIAKCEVRCPNCHKMRHYHERQAKKAA